MAGKSLVGQGDEPEEPLVGIEEEDFEREEVKLLAEIDCWNWQRHGAIEFGEFDDFRCLAIPAPEKFPEDAVRDRARMPVDCVFLIHLQSGHRHS